MDSSAPFFWILATKPQLYMKISHVMTSPWESNHDLNESEENMFNSAVSVESVETMIPSGLLYFYYIWFTETWENSWSFEWQWNG